MNIKTKQKKRISGFRLFYLMLIAALILCAVLFLGYVRKSLSMYEAAQPERFMDGVLSSIRSMSAEELSEKIEFPDTDISVFDDFEAYKQSFAQRLLDSELTLSGGKNIGKNVVYELCADGEKAAEITIRSVGEDVRLGLMSIPDWELAGIAAGETETYTYEITYPSIYRVLINGREPGQENLIGEAPIPGFEYTSKYVDMPVMITCRLENLIAEPEITVYNNLGEKIPFEPDGRTAVIEPVFCAETYPEELKAEADALQIAETWSKFLTRDLSGPKYGLEEARSRFIKGSDFWNMAYDYAVGVDITFVSDHRLVSFTNESVSDYIRYTEDCFSCVVYFEKNMALSRSGEPRTDIFNSRLFFVYYDDTDDGMDNPRWLISDMQAVTYTGE